MGLICWLIMQLGLKIRFKGWFRLGILMIWLRVRLIWRKNGFGGSCTNLS